MALDMSRITVSAFLKNANKSVSSSSARRCLFGPVNHEENARFLKEQLAQQERESKAKWNFDFRTETPVAGKFKWERLGDDENQVPIAYSMPQLFAKTPVTPSKKACKPLSFSSKLNFNAVSQTLKTDTTSTSKCECPLSTSTTSSVVSSTTDRVPALGSSPVLETTNLSREETPSSFVFSATKDDVVATTTTQYSTSSASSSSSAISHPTAKSLKRKVSQTDITEFFQIKKSRNVVAASSAKRKLNL